MSASLTVSNSSTVPNTIATSGVTQTLGGVMVPYQLISRATFIVVVLAFFGVCAMSDAFCVRFDKLSFMTNVYHNGTIICDEAQMCVQS